ncbi:beta-galactosidase [Novosphingobium sp.]|uniref:beta-galactosidase n=1 Tax=Novosphingobium sp. TaxID=1874826 RepID=UPI0022C015B4|nr:beta-galactosidase [Novosphingobium sp.]MCZ8019046.1 beta-galactosidase [Novosphingobium sp.]MCZ8034854.1 beta-galactosidase [Novosphingobium sp.]MCZ8052422.1 beta-galactosidase [Novosphingobium sp.]MCZ8058521.1 beta-galactosidase [Novosphingobium sp.]MCZ8232918.1 beta-galactosidase [Novosphingobium sp.]
MKLGTCYYPEHWPEAWWADDARRMAETGLAQVRIGEFAWSRIEPEPGRFDWGWLDRAIDTLHLAGLEVILGTPTATPPKWLVDKMPDMVAIDAQGRPRGFGSRRHYCFSHQGYRAEAVRITRAVAERYGHHPAVVAWQTDNEYGCHDTVLSFSAAARAGFRRWLAQRYGTVAALNAAWGNVFWSMDYRSFDEVDLPNLTVTEANPAHWLAFRRYSSDQVVAFNRAQVEVLRKLSPGRDVVHNYMGFFTEFDHHAVAADLDVVGWDSYPLGFLDTFRFSEADKLAYARQGHPDIAAFHHDLYRGCTPGGRWSVLEQQPGPVNWARHNPAPLPGMVRLWTLEAMAHGAELVSYFRWRQFPQAQEQHHAGLLRPDSEPAPGLAEARQAADDIAALGPVGAPPKSVALIFAYDADWVTGIQPQGAGLSALWAAFDCYSALRELGLDIDIVPPGTALDGFALVVIPCLPIVPEHLVEDLKRFPGQIVIGPRTGSRTVDFAIPAGLAPGDLFPAKVARVESLRPGLEHRGDGWAIARWLEHLETAAAPELVAGDGTVASWQYGNRRYLGAWPDRALALALLGRAAADAGLATHRLPEGLRLRRAGSRLFAFNYAAQAVDLPASVVGTALLGGPRLEPGGVAVLAQE